MSDPPRIGPYEILRPLGSGGMATVYAVRDPELPRELALKLLTRISPRAEARFTREAELLARVRHPGVVRVHTCGRAEGGGHYLVTDLVEGIELAELCEGRGLEPARAARIAASLADAVAALHDVGILHRDLKPQNVMLQADDAPVLIDFGLARTDDVQRLTQTGQLVGTPAYMAPEQALGTREAVDERTDVYGLGAVLFHLLTGQAPFSGDTLLEMVGRAASQDVQWPAKRRVPVELRTICETALAKSPGNRYASAAALATDLRRHLEGEAIAARPLGRRVALAFAGVVFLVGISAGLLAVGSGPGQAIQEPSPPPAVEAPTEPDGPESLLAQLDTERGHPHERWEAAKTWLAANPRHPRRPEVEAHLPKLREAFPYHVRLFPSQTSIRSLHPRFVGPTQLLDGGREDARVWGLGPPIQLQRSFSLSLDSKLAGFRGARTAALGEGDLLLGRLLYESKTGELHRLNLETGTIARLPVDPPWPFSGLSAEPAPDGRSVFVVRVDSEGTAPRVYRVSLSGEGDPLLVANHPPLVRLVRAAGDDLLATISGRRMKGTSLAGWSPHTLALHRPSLGPSPLRTILCEFSSPTCLTFTPDHSVFVLGTSHGSLFVEPVVGERDRFRLANGLVSEDLTSSTDQGGMIGQRAHGGMVIDARFLGGARLLSLGETDVRLWDLTARELLVQFGDVEGTALSGFAVSPDDRWAVLARRGSPLELWALPPPP